MVTNRQVTAAGVFRVPQEKTPGIVPGVVLFASR
jgi:hypothetical protein